MVLRLISKGLNLLLDCELATLSLEVEVCRLKGFSVCLGDSYRSILKSYPSSDSKQKSYKNVQNGNKLIPADYSFK